MNKIKKYIVLLVVAILCMNINVPIVHAENITLYISVSSSQVNVGDSITVTVSYSYSGSFAADFNLSWSGPVTYSGGSIPSSGVISVMGNGSSSATFTATDAGTASFSVSGAGMDIVTEADLGVSSQGASVTITAPSNNTTTEAPTTEAPSNNTTTEAPKDDNDSNTFLASLSINPGKLNPEFSPYTNSYTAQVDEDVTKINVSATADDSNSVVSVWGANDLEPGENLVQVAVTADDGDVRYYDIHVMVGEDMGTPFTEVDGAKYGFIDYEDGVEQPEGFTKTTLKYEKWEVMAYQSPNKLLKIVPLVKEESEDEEYSWFVYNEATNDFSPYNEYSANYVRYVIRSLPEGVEIPEGFVETNITINANKIVAYQSDNVDDKHIYLVYAMNLSGGEGFYVYDMSEGSFMRYVPMVVEKEKIVIATPTEATPTVATPLTPVSVDEGFFTKEVLLYITCGAVALLIIFIIVLCCVAGKNKNLKEELDEAESMVAQLTGYEMADEPVKSSKKEKKPKKEKEPKEPKESKKEKPQKEPKMSDVDLFASTYAATEEDLQDKYMRGEEIDEGEVVNAAAPVEEVNVVGDIPTLQGFGDLTDTQTPEADYEKQSEIINSKIKENYDANMDSAFADGNDN